jgi:hypothetical protein
MKSEIAKHRILLFNPSNVVPKLKAKILTKIIKLCRDFCLP